MKETTRLGKIRIALDNALSQPIVAEYLAEYGYNKETIAEGELLYENYVQAADAARNKSFEVEQASNAYRERFKNFEAQYREHRKLAKIKFKGQEAVLKTLDLISPFDDNTLERMSSMRRFYYGLKGDKALVGVLKTVKIDDAVVKAAIREFGVIENEKSQVQRHRGVLQSMNAVKSEQFERLQMWTSDFLQVARIALKGNEQLLEVLGVTVK